MTGGGTTPPGALPDVVLYERDGCGLCQQAAELLARLAPKLRFTLSRVNIETDDDLLKRYVLEIPVVAVGGREVARAPIRSAAAFEEALRSAIADLPPKG